MKSLTINISDKLVNQARAFYLRFEFLIITLGLTGISVYYFFLFYVNKLGLSYNDARSHLDIGRRVVEGLKPGLAQLGSVWLPLNHILMVPTIWNNWMWHSGLSGAIESMISFVVTGLVISLLLKKLNVGIVGRLTGVAVFVANLNVLYLQSTAMTELLLLATMTLGVYELVMWHDDNSLLHFIKSAFYIMLSTLVRYDGWFLLFYTAFLVYVQLWYRKEFKKAQAMFIAFMTLGGFGIALWFLWNQVIFKDALYFALGPFSAHAQQEQMDKAGVLITKGNLLLSLKIYLYALAFNSYTYQVIIGFIGMVVLWFDKTIKRDIRIATSGLLAPFVFNVLALFLGFSVLFVQGISGNTWFNVRYGIMLMPSIAIYIGYIVDRAKNLRNLLLVSLFFVTFFALFNGDAVTLDDARVGSSQKNVSEVSGYLQKHAAQEKGFILISAASHDAIIFSSNLPMNRFIHEGTGKYWESATSMPDQWARWIVTRTYDDNDRTWALIKKSPGLAKFNLVAKYPFADVYEIKPEYVRYLKTEPIFGKQR
jgi:hypothetical protein